MRYPEYIKKGEAFGFPAPSFGASFDPYASRLKNAVRLLGDLGHPSVLGPNAFLAEGVGISNTPEKCAEELTEMYCSDDTRALLSVGGGELMCEDLSFMDFDKIKAARPKWFCGYSDNTNFAFLLPTLCDTAAIYGPGATDFGREPWHESIQAAYHIFTGESLALHGFDSWEKDSWNTASMTCLADYLAPYLPTEPTINVLKNWDGSPVSGRFLGGCLDCLKTLCGTRFDRVAEFNEKYGKDGVIWFLEACDLNVIDIRRTLWQLREAGWFRAAKAFIIGRPLAAYQEILLGMDRFEAVTSVLGDLGLPMILDADLGHLPPMIPMIEGGYGTLRYDGRIEIRYTGE